MAYRLLRTVLFPRVRKGSFVEVGVRNIEETPDRMLEYALARLFLRMLPIDVRKQISSTGKGLIRAQ